MKKTTTTAVSGCIVWFFLISIIGSCIMPVFFMIGGFSSVSDVAIQLTGSWICDDGTTPQTYSYQTTTTDQYGNRQPSTAYVLQCVDSSGNVVKDDPIAYAFIWIGIWALLGVIVTGVLCLVFAVPGGMLITKFLEQIRINNKPLIS